MTAYPAGRPEFLGPWRLVAYGDVLRWERPCGVGPTVLRMLGPILPNHRAPLGVGSFDDITHPGAPA